MAVVSACDELVELVLHCILDLGSFPDARRRRVSELMTHLRSDPPAAGRAAERVQQELAPALEWSALIAAVVQERWEDLLGRRRRLSRHLLWRSPLDTLRGSRRSRTDGSRPGE